MSFASAVRPGRDSSPARPLLAAFPRKFSKNNPLYTILDESSNHANTYPHSTNLTAANSPSRISQDQLPPLPSNQELPAEKIDASIDKWFFISGAAA